MRPFDFFSTLNMERQTDQQTYLPIEMQFYIYVMFLGLPDNIQEKKPTFLNFENNWLRTDRRTNGPMDRRMDRPSYRDARTHLKMSGRAGFWVIVQMEEKLTEFDEI